MSNVQVSKIGYVTTYKMVNGEAVKVLPREHNEGKPGFAALLTKRYPVPVTDADWQEQRANIESEINKLRLMDRHDEWPDNSLVFRGVSVGFAIDFLLDLIKDKQDAMTHKTVIVED